MKKLSKKEYNNIVKAKILQTGLYNGRSVEEAEVCDELFEHLQDPSLTAYDENDKEIGFLDYSLKNNTLCEKYELIRRKKSWLTKKKEHPLANAKRHSQGD